MLLFVLIHCFNIYGFLPLPSPGRALGPLGDGARLEYAGHFGALAQSVGMHAPASGGLSRMDTGGPQEGEWPGHWTSRTDPHPKEISYQL